MNDEIKDYYKNLLVGAEPWAIEQVEQEINQLIAQVETLLAKVVELEKDEDRLDWLDTAEGRRWQGYITFVTRSAIDGGYTRGKKS